MRMRAGAGPAFSSGLGRRVAVAGLAAAALATAAACERLGAGTAMILTEIPWEKRAKRSTTPSHIASRGQARPRRLRVRGLARRGRAARVADAPARAAGPARLAVQVGVGLRGLEGSAGRAPRAGVRRRGGRLPRSSRVLDRRLG